MTGCSSSRAFAHILGRAVLAQKKANVGACVPIRKKDDNRYAEFKIAQKALNKEMMAKERLLSCSQAKQSVLDSIISSGKRTATGEKEKQKRTEKEIESETLDTTIASFSYET